VADRQGVRGGAAANGNASLAGAASKADDWVTGIAARLRAAGFSVAVHKTAAGPHVTATWHRPGRKEVELIVDEAGYIELRWWADGQATSASLADVLSAVTFTALTVAAHAADDGDARP
jgi:hypothetical protein